MTKEAYFVKKIFCIACQVDEGGRTSCRKKACGGSGQDRRKRLLEMTMESVETPASEGTYPRKAGADSMPKIEKKGGASIQRGPWKARATS